jgi:nucleotide-binding universal stress UspA family protein
MEMAKPITHVSIVPGAGHLSLRAREAVMFEIRTILYPTDFSDESAAAFGVACSLGKKYGAEVVVLHVAPSMTFGEFADQARMAEDEEQLMDDSLRPIQSPEPGVRVRHQLERGDAAELIVSVAQDLGCDLIVMGTHGRNGLSRLFMGSVAEHVLRTAPCPVLTVREAPVAAPAARHASLEQAPLAR